MLTMACFPPAVAETNDETAGQGTTPLTSPSQLEEPTYPKERYRIHELPDAFLRAPRPGDRFASDKMEIMSREAIWNAMQHPIEFGAPGLGFEMPDWRNPTETATADTWRHDITTDDSIFEGNVQTSWGAMTLQANRLRINQTLGDFEAEALDLRQANSQLLADRAYYWVPESLEGTEPQLLDPEFTEQEQARLRLSKGLLDADNVYVSEPTRELRADHLEFDFGNMTGEITNARGRAGVIFYKAKKLRILGQETFSAEDVWLTTCDPDHPYYRIHMKELYVENGITTQGSRAQLYLGKVPTPFYLPKFRRDWSGLYAWDLDFDTGHRAELGYYLNVGQRYEVAPNVSMGPRIFATHMEGIGLGADMAYDFREDPAAGLFRTSGTLHTLYTTEERGYIHWNHRYDHSEDLVLKTTVEHWSDSEFFKDFYYDEYRDRTAPRSFANLTYRQPTYIATGTVRLNTHPWLLDTERTPEVTYHLLERPLADNLYFSFDTINGYNNMEPIGPSAYRTVNIARLSYSLDMHPALSLTPFYEANIAGYSSQWENNHSTGRMSNTFGTTLQTRLHRIYDGAFGFSKFKHIIVPSITIFHRPDSSIDVEDSTYFDTADIAFGRTRVETKIDNVIYGRDATSQDVWRVARLSLYHGDDFENQHRDAQDYEIEIDLRPRPWWGIQFVGEVHEVDGDAPEETAFFYDWFNSQHGDFPIDTSDLLTEQQYNILYADYERVLTELYYDSAALNGRWNGRLGFMYTKTLNQVFNRDIRYGLGYRIGDHWGVAFEHWYDLERDTLRSQSYEIRRSFQCLETALRFRDRESGFDIDFAVQLTAFSTSPLLK